MQDGKLSTVAGEGLKAVLPDRLTARLLAGTFVLLVLTVVFATDVDDYIYPNDLLGRTVTDLVVLLCVVLPAFYFALFRPLLRVMADRRRSEEALKLRAWEMGALNALSEVAARERDMESLLVGAMDVVLPVFGADGGWIQVAGSEGASSARVLVSRGLPNSLESTPSGLCMDCPTRCWGAMEGLPEGEIGLITECREMPREALRSAGFEGYAGVLLPVGRDVRAVLNLLWRSPRTLGDPEAALLRSMARQLGIAAENSALDSAERAARERADAIASISLALNRTLDLDAVLKVLLENLRRFVPFDRAKVMLVEGGARLKVQAVFAPSGERDPVGSPSGTFLVPDSPCVHEVLTTRQSLCVDDLRGHPGLASRPEGTFERSWLGVPLLADGRTVGLLTLVKAEPGFYTRGQVTLAEALAAPASVAIANARLFGEVRSARERLETLSRRLVDVQESERRHLARELHDEVGQSLAAILCRLGALKEIPSAAVGIVDDTMEIADRTFRMVRELSLDLHPALLDEVGLAETLRWYIDRQVRSDSLEVGLTISPDAISLSPDVRNACFRVAQEALTNVVRHAGAHHARVRLRMTGTQVELAIRDDGRGFDVEEACRRSRKGQSLGILGMRERAELQGGRLLLESRPGRGTTVRALFPASGAASPDPVQ